MLPLALSLALASDPSALVASARRQIGVTFRYDGAYVRLGYPGGDVPLDRGVCTDVVIRALRDQGHDLQRLVHEDRRRAGTAYPNLWNQRGLDRSIDHRRVPNLATFFTRHGVVLPRSRTPSDYRPGELVTWRLSSGLPHIGVVSDRLSPAGVPLVIHHLGGGVQEEDVLFAWPVTGRYRFPR